MAYNTYTTEALVCGTWDRNTSDKSYLLFTKDAGMLYADARSARMEKSKQRYALQDFSYVRVSLVKGKGGWRIGSVESRSNHYQNASSKESRGSVVQLYRSLRRFYKGEEASPELFAYITDALSVLSEEVIDRHAVETVVMARLLYELGYIDKKFLLAEALQPVKSDLSLEEPILSRTEKLLEKAATSSQL